MEDGEPFIEWLQAQGLTDEAHLNAYRRFAAELAKHPSLSAALRAADEAGTPAREIANLRKVAAKIVEFEAARAAPSGPATPRLEVEPRTKAPSIEPRMKSPSVEPRTKAPSIEPRGQAAAGALDVEPRQPRPAAASIDVEPRQPRPAAAMRDTTPRRRGCVCNKHYDLYLDDDFGALARMFGGGIGIGTIVLVRLIGLLGALTLALGLAGMGGLVTITSICMRCEGCRRRVKDLDADERARVRKGRGRVVLVTLALIIGAALCAAAWWSILKSQRRGY